MNEAMQEMTVLISKFETFEKNYKKCSTQNRTKGYLEGRLKGIDKLWDAICEKDVEIKNIAQVHGEEIPEYITNDYFSELEEKYFLLIGSINEFLRLFTPPQPVIINSTGQNQSSNHSRNNQSNVKLPKISLPTFSGTYDTWISFKTRFSSLIHTNTELTNAEKLDYLKSCMKDKAEKAIRRYQVTDENYPLAWKRLNDKYDNKRILQVTQVETLLDRKAVTTESAAELRDLIDVMQESLESLKILNINTDTWDPMLIVLLTRKLPFETRSLWEQTLKPTDVPTYAQLCEFLEQRYRTLECLELVGGAEKEPKPKYVNKTQYQVPNRNKSIPNGNHNLNCAACNEASHSLTVCETFLNMSLPNRNAFVYAKRLCKNCLAYSHITSECRSQKTCFKCKGRHHTLLHKEESNSNQSSQTFSNSHQLNPNPFNRSTQKRTYVTHTPQAPQINQTQAPQVQQPNLNSNPQTQANQNSQSSGNQRTYTSVVPDEVSLNPAYTQKAQPEVLFPTILVKVESASGTIYTLRALMDQCSSSSFIKESAARLLGLRTNSVPAFDVTGLDDVVTATVKSATNYKIRALQAETIDIEAFVISTLVGILPKTEIKWPEHMFMNIQLADPTFATPGNVDMMLGAKIYAHILLEGVLKKGGYIAQNTMFGWMISGQQMQEVPQRTLICLSTRVTPQDHHDDILKKFWEIEEPPKGQKILSKEEKKCEEMFMKSYRRLENGRVQVKLPFKVNPAETLGASRNLAIARWTAMEKKLDRDPKLKEDYMKAMQEYWDLGHMTRVSTKESDHAKIGSDGKVNYSCYYIPHHAVINEESKTTKTRIVFDASAKSSTKVSLNDTLMIGPTIQESLLVRLVKWRVHKFALRGDITKMYRQIAVHDDDTNYQRMVFRFNKADPIEDFRLLTLTFGTACAPYYAIRSLQQLARDEEKKFPIGSKVVLSDFHVDDLLTGSDSVEKVKEIWNETKNLLETAGFPMRKWSSNDNKILEQIPEEEREIKSSEIRIDDVIKTLGISWLPVRDHFLFKVPIFNQQERLTKRNFLSQAGKLFDPLGWLGPVIIKPKMMFQGLWKEGIEWDAQISKKLADEWISFREKLRHLETIRIPRWYGFETSGYAIELHGFCDASIRAYGAVVYVKSTDSNGNSQISLILAKSRVAPVQTITLPRLELCGGVLLAQLINKLSDILKISKMYCWIDSSIALAQIDSIPDKHHTFVANRISEVQSLTDSKIWRHVSSDDNPADCLSRGIQPEELKHHKLWWKGPQWLKYPKEQWPKNENVKIPEELLELKGVKALVSTANSFWSITMNKFSSFVLLCRVMARIRRLFRKDSPKSKALLWKEIMNERMIWIKYAQDVSFKSEIKMLKEEGRVNKKSKIIGLYPFLDRNGILRVGGRLKEALIDFEAKHQIIIPKRSSLAKLIVNDAHLRTKHGGTQLTMTYTRTQYWIISTRNTVKFNIKGCVICHRYSKQVQEQLMGNLPEPRVNMSRAFLHTGVDYAGPFQILTRRKPGKREVTKGWVSLFVCLCTKAIHLELVSDQTTDAFLAAFTRFTCRRGLPSNMYSDNSSTFVGARNEMEHDYKIVRETIEPELAEIVIRDNVEWSFIPPSAPHFGGLWEAGVKSMKHHLQRMVQTSVHTYEEVTTMLAEIEACLNSRPLCPISDDPNDLSILTPGHFLIASNLLAPPRPSLLDIQVNRLGMWKQISQTVEHFAKRWKAEYLSRLQHRNKWMRQCANVEVGDMVLIKDDNLPPSKWLLGRIIETFPDDEGLVRSVRVKTAKSSLVRPIAKISLLPIDKAVSDSPPNNPNE